MFADVRFLPALSWKPAAAILPTIMTLVPTRPDRPLRRNTLSGPASREHGTGTAAASEAELMLITEVIHTIRTTGIF
jgi:hypothetical protein